jgi:hypothetical protein
LRRGRSHAEQKSSEGGVPTPFKGCQWLVVEGKGKRGWGGGGGLARREARWKRKRGGHGRVRWQAGDMSNERCGAGEAPAAESEGEADDSWAG